MRVLVGCEFSGVVRDAFLKRGHEAYSCDLLETESSGPHYQCDIRDVVGLGWDLLIAFPPCTYLCSSGLHWNRRRPGRALLTEEAIEFVRFLLGLKTKINRIALENPIGCISKRIRPPDQIIQPWQFGSSASKATCLWLENLPKLKPTNIILPNYGCHCGQRFHRELGAFGCPKCKGIQGPAKLIYDNQTPSGQNKLSGGMWKERSKTFPGVAEAMAEQWGSQLTRPRTFF